MEKEIYRFTGKSSKKPMRERAVWIHLENGVWLNNRT